jgi:hypothetical protein
VPSVAEVVARLAEEDAQARSASAPLLT